MPPRINVSDLAKILNLSKASVAAALAGHGGNTRVSAETAQRVKELARRLNYRANASARTIQSKRFNTIGWLVAKKDPSDYSFSDIISHGISIAAERCGQNVFLLRTPDSPDAVPRSLREACLDALIIQDAESLSRSFIEAVESYDVPVVYINEKRPTNSVYIDDVESGRIMGRHLLDRGFRRVAILAPVTSVPHYSSEDRARGCEEVLRESGTKPLMLRDPSDSWRARIRSLLQSKRRPEAIFCVDDLLALQLQIVLYDLRLRVPDDIAIAGCNDELMAFHSSVPLTTLKVPFYEMAQAAVAMTMTLIESPSPSSLPSIALKPTLTVRSSTQFQDG